MRRLALIGFLVLAATVFTAARASADGLEICNKTGETIHVAVAVGGLDASTHVAKGWWNVPAGQCRVVVPAPLNADWNYFYYGFTESGKRWGGTWNYCVDPGHAFAYVDPYTPCERGDVRGFGQIPSKGDLDFTLNLVGTGDAAGGATQLPGFSVAPLPQ